MNGIRTARVSTIAAAATAVALMVCGNSHLTPGVEAGSYLSAHISVQSLGAVRPAWLDYGSGTSAS